MFMVKDKTGQEVFLKDKVRYSGAIDEMGLTGDIDGLVIALLSESMIQVQPLGGGVPVSVKGEESIVIDSLIQRVANLSSNEELQALLADVEKRHATAVDAAKKPRAKRTGGAKTPVVVEEAETVEVEL